MNTLDVTITKRSRTDLIEIRRENGAIERYDFPKKGPIPHDAVHFFVEEALEFQHGFWGMVAMGVRPAEIQEIAKAAGHASAKRASKPDPRIVELLQAERIVECFEADFWGAPADPDTFRSVVHAACAASFVEAPPTLDDAIINAIRARIAAFAASWMAAAEGVSFAFAYRPPAALAIAPANAPHS